MKSSSSVSSPRLAVVSSSQLDLFPSQLQLDLTEPHTVLLVFLILVLLVRLARELAKLFRYLLKLIREFIPREPIIPPDHDMLQTVVVEANNASSRVSRIVEIMEVFASQPHRVFNHKQLPYEEGYRTRGIHPQRPELNPIKEQKGTDDPVGKLWQVVNTIPVDVQVPCYCVCRFGFVKNDVLSTMHPEVTLDKETDEVKTEKDPNPLICDSFEDFFNSVAWLLLPLDEGHAACCEEMVTPMANAKGATLKHLQMHINTIMAEVTQKPKPSPLSYHW